MARTAVHTEDVLLDQALVLYAEGGPRAVTMAGVARAAGAPSGSLYHRFPDRSALLAALWLRTTGRFEDGFRSAVGDGSPSADGAVGAARWAVAWCAEHPAEAALLNAGRRGLHPETWSAEAQRELADRSGRRDRFLTAYVDAVAEATGRAPDEVSFAVFDLPLAVIKRHLDAGHPVPDSATDLVARLVSRLLT
jgi:AcrR family transcriptional regulator